MSAKITKDSDLVLMIKDIKISNFKIDADKKQIIAMYKEAFPFNERIPIFFLKRIIKKERLIVHKLYNEEKLIGFTLTSEPDDFNYLYFFGISSEFRNKGFGKQIIDLYVKETTKPLLILVHDVPKDAKDNDINIRRINFYKRAGFVEQDYKVKEYTTIYRTFNVKGYVSFNQYQTMMKNIMGTLIFNLMFKNNKV